jgi:hypothetical protein
LTHEEQVNSTRLFTRGLNRFGITPIGDAGGGTQAYPEDYQIYTDLASQGELSLLAVFFIGGSFPVSTPRFLSGWVEPPQLSPTRGTTPACPSSTPRTTYTRLSDALAALETPPSARSLSFATFRS